MISAPQVQFHVILETTNLIERQLNGDRVKRLLTPHQNTTFTVGIHTVVYIFERRIRALYR